MADDVTEAAAIAAAEEVLHPHDVGADVDVRRQMQSMLERDRLMAYGFVIALLVVLPFILVVIWRYVPTDGIRVVLVAACAVVLVYNVASMVALVRNYQRDRDFVYRRDVAHLRERDALRAARAGR